MRKSKFSPTQIAKILKSNSSPPQALRKTYDFLRAVRLMSSPFLLTPCTGQISHSLLTFTRTLIISLFIGIQRSKPYMIYRAKILLSPLSAQALMPRFGIWLANMVFHLKRSGQYPCRQIRPLRQSRPIKLMAFFTCVHQLIV